MSVAGKLEVFDARTSQWTAVGADRVELEFPPGGGVLVRLADIPVR